MFLRVTRTGTDRALVGYKYVYTQRIIYIHIYYTRTHDIYVYTERKRENKSVPQGLGNQGLEVLVGVGSRQCLG